MRPDSLRPGVRPGAAPFPNTQNPGIYFDFFARMPDFAVVPHISRHPPAAAAGLSGEGRAWDWIQEQIREEDRNPEWFRNGLIEKIGVAFSHLSNRVGDCRFPLYVSPQMAPDLRELWNVVSER